MALKPFYCSPCISSHSLLPSCVCEIIVTFLEELSGFINYPWEFIASQMGFKTSDDLWLVYIVIGEIKGHLGKM